MSVLAGRLPLSDGQVEWRGPVFVGFGADGAGVPDRKEVTGCWTVVSCLVRMCEREEESMPTEQECPTEVGTCVMCFLSIVCQHVCVEYAVAHLMFVYRQALESAVC